MEQITRKIDALLEQRESSKNKVRSATIFMTRPEDKDKMNAVWTQWLAKENLPARVTIGVAELGAGILVEFIASAAVN